MRRGFTPRSLKSASCRRRTRFSASIDRRVLTARTSRPLKSASRHRTVRAKAITPTSCHGFHARIQPQPSGSSYCGGQCPGLGTPATPGTLALSVAWMLPSASLTASAFATRNQISELILTACFLAMYASHPPVARRMATRATGLPATALTGLDLHQLDFNKRFR